MTIAILALDRPANALKVGDLVPLEITLDEKIGSPGDKWILVSTDTQGWMPSGTFTIALDSLELLPGDGNITQLKLEATLHEGGSLHAGPFSIRHETSGQEFVIPQTQLGETEVQAVQSDPAAPWTLPAVAFGGWNVLLLVLLGLVLAGLFGLLGRFIWRKYRARAERKRTHKYVALQALRALQKFARAKKPPEQEEWKKFSFELASILRKFSDQNFHFDSSDMTDREYLSELRLRLSAKDQVDTVAAILAKIDEVRYGKKTLDLTVVPGLLLDAQKFVETTYKGPEEEGAK